MTDKSNCTFNISGGNVQILPNATQGIQNFYGDQFAEEALKASVNTNPGNAAPELSDEEYNPQNEMFVNRKTKRYIFKTKRIFFGYPSIIQIMWL